MENLGQASFFQKLCFFIRAAIFQLMYSFKACPTRLEENAEGKIVVITGANSGIGLSAAEGFAQRGAVVVMACRDMVKAEKANKLVESYSLNNSVELVHLDLADLSSIRSCAETIIAKYSHIDILVNNAGIALTCSTRKFTKDGFELHMGVNHLGHFLFTNLLLNNLKKSADAKIVTVSSAFAYLQELDLKNLMMENVGLGILNLLPYCNCKFANILFTKELAKRLEGSSIKTYAVCPGLVNSDIGRDFSIVTKFLANAAMSIGGFNVAKGADAILYCALAKELSTSSGDMFHLWKKFSAIESFATENLAAKLWKESELLVGFNSSQLICKP